MTMKNARGFTLIEVLLSVAILATMSALIARSITQAVKAKVKLQDQIDDVSRMRDALKLMERDINLAYHHRDFEKELNDLLKKKYQGGTTGGGNGGGANTGGSGGSGGFGPGFGTPGTSGPPPGSQSNLPEALRTQREAERKDPATHFVGQEDGFSFVTMNNARMVRNTRQADFIEVGYALKNCTSADGKRQSKCLWRRSSPVVDDDVTIGGDEVVLLEDVSEFTVKYIGKGKQDWVSTWRTDKGGDAATKDNFPQAVQISLAIQKGAEGVKKKKYSMQIVVPIHFPNNKEEQQGGQTPGSPQNQFNPPI